MISCRLLLPLTAAALTLATLGCNTSGTSTHRANLFTAREAQTGSSTYHRGGLPSFSDAGAPTIQRHARTIQPTLMVTHHHMRGTI